MPGRRSTATFAGDVTSLRGSRAVTVLTAVAGVILVVGTIGPPLFGQGVFLAGDLLEHTDPWQAVEDRPLDYGRHGQVSDTVDTVYPSRVTFFEALRDGELLGWDPSTAGGRARGAHSGTGVFDPIAFPAYLVAPGWYAPALVKLLTMAVAIGFTFLFCRRVGTDRVPAALAGLAFAGSGFMVMWTNWPQAEVTALIPALFWATERFLQGPRISTAVPVALALAGMLLGQFPAIAFYALYLLGPYVLVRAALIYRRSGREAMRPLVGRLGGAAGAAAAGVLLVTVVLLPFALSLGDLDIGDRREVPGNNLHVPTLVTAVAPEALGLSSQLPDSTYIGHHNQVEAVSFVGVTVLLLALAGLALPRLAATPPGSREVLAGGTLILGWATFGGGPLLRLLQQLPAFDNSFIGRTRSVLGFAVAVLAALGLQAVIERQRPTSRRQWRWAIGVAVATAVVGVFVGWRALQLVRDAGRTDVLRSGLVLPLVIGVLACGAIVVLWSGRRGVVAAVALACLPLLFAVEAVAFAAPVTPNVDRSELYPSPPAIDYLVEHAGDERLAPEGWVLFGSASSVYGLRSATGHSFYTEEWKEVLLAADPEAFAGSETFPLLEGSLEVVSSPMFDRLGVGWWAGSPHTPPPGRRVGRAATSATCEETVEVADDDAVTVEIPPVEASEDPGLRAIVVRVCGGSPQGTTLGAELEGVDRSAGWTPVGMGELGNGAPASREVSIALPGEGLEAPGEATIRLTADGPRDRAATISLAATPDGEPVVDVIRSTDDGLRLVYAKDLRIYRRTRSLERVRWAARSVAIADGDQRLELLASGDLAGGTVVLNEEGEATSGAPADVVVARDDPSHISVDVDAAGAGYLVVSDALQHDWVPTVDGEPAELVAADHAGVAVHVPEGEHRVELSFRPRGQRLGLAISALTALLLGLGVLWERKRR